MEHMANGVTIKLMLQQKCIMCVFKFYQVETDCGFHDPNKKGFLRIYLNWESLFISKFMHMHDVILFNSCLFHMVSYNF